MSEEMYDIARRVTNKVLGAGTYEDLNRGNPDPGVQAAIERGRRDMPEEQKTQTARCGVDVFAGVLPGTPEPEFTRQWFITSEEWHAEEGKNQAELLSDLAGKACAWATYCMLQPDRFNWVKTEWIWF